METAHLESDRITLELELWIRPVTATITDTKRERIVDRLERLADTDAVDGVAVNDWTTAIDREDRSTGAQRIESTLARFERWADRVERTLEPFFRTRRVESAFTGESTVVSRPPTIALAEYHDGDLVHVSPCRSGERRIDVEDRLDDLANDSLDGSMAEFQSGDPTDARTRAERESSAHPTDVRHGDELGTEST